jgi:hypothetical protein
MKLNDGVAPTPVARVHWCSWAFSDGQSRRLLGVYGGFTRRDTRSDILGLNR